MNEAISIMEHKFEQNLGIDTLGNYDWHDHRGLFNRYEPTPYKYLDILFKKYKIHEGDQFVDFGCGKGRVLFYVHDRFQIPVSGIEANAEVFAMLEENYQSYRYKKASNLAKIDLNLCFAETYTIKPQDNIFYFFNPFDISIFKQVVENIIASIQEYPRSVDIILYYPMKEFTRYLTEDTPFEMEDRILLPNLFDLYEKFVIFRLQ